jgi:hypothetical protein
VSAMVGGLGALVAPIAAPVLLLVGFGPTGPIAGKDSLFAMCFAER